MRARVICLECGSMVVPVVEQDGIIYYSPHYIPGGMDSTGFCPNISKVPKQILDSVLNSGVEFGGKFYGVVG